MKIVILALVCLLGCSMAFDVQQGLDFLEAHQNFEWVVDTAMNGTEYIAVELHSLEFNKIRIKLTSYKEDTPAFDMLFDYNEGYMLFYYNNTGDCRVKELPKKNLKEYYKDILMKHTQYAGKRGHLHLFEVEQPDVGIKTWVYGAFLHSNEHHHGHFLPVRMQFHNPMLHVDYTYEFMDTISFPKVSESDFDYSMCKKAIQSGESESTDTIGVTFKLLERFFKDM